VPVRVRFVSELRTNDGGKLMRRSE
jgi:hypothetical protein